LRLFCRTSARRQLDELLQKLTPIVVRHTARLEGLARSATGRKHVLPRAVFLKKEHPEWSDAQIARAIGCEQSALSKSAEWRRIKAQVERVLRIDSAGRFADGRGRRVDDEDPEGDPSTGPGG
jgi:hypothetical protein